jgi:hypothetical protein
MASQTVANTTQQPWGSATRAYSCAWRPVPAATCPPIAPASTSVALLDTFDLFDGFTDDESNDGIVAPVTLASPASEAVDAHAPAADHHREANATNPMMTSRTQLSIPYCDGADHCPFSEPPRPADIQLAKRCNIKGDADFHGEVNSNTRAFWLEPFWLKPSWLESSWFKTIQSPHS